MPEEKKRMMHDWFAKNRALIDGLKNMYTLKRKASSKYSADAWFMREMSKIPGFGSWMPKTE